MRSCGDYCVRKPFSLIWRTEQVTTAMLEDFHALKIAYLPKKTFLGIDKMIADTKIAALDHNHNVNREQVQTTIIQATIIFFAISINLIYSTI